MADGSTVNSQITDSVNQVDTLLLANSASGSMSILDIVTAETLGMSMHNAVSSQQNSQVSASAAVTASCAKMLAVSQLPEAEKESEKTDVPPPFMPLDGNTSSEQTAEQLVKQATEMAELAIKKIEASDSQTDKDVSVLEGLMSKIKALTGSDESTGSDTSNQSAKKNNSKDND